MKPQTHQSGPRALLTILFLVVLTTAVAGCASASEITAVPKDSLVVDVRTPAEFESWHYPGAINIPVQVLAERIAELEDKNRSIIVYCRSGNRSTTAKNILIDNGFSDVKNGGGLKDMKKFVTP